MSRKYYHAIECACQEAREALVTGEQRLVILTSTESSEYVRKIIGTMMPPGSSCTGSVWKNDAGQLISVKRYSDLVPAYPGNFAVRVCNGGKVLSRGESNHVRRWRDAAQALHAVGA